MSIKRKVRKLEEQKLTASDVEREMRICISAARSNPDPVKQKRFNELFGDRTPSPQEFIRVLTREVQKKKEQDNQHKTKNLLS